jgi:hypothetical protein
MFQLSHPALIGSVVTISGFTKLLVFFVLFLLAAATKRDWMILFTFG